MQRLLPPLLVLILLGLMAVFHRWIPGPEWLPAAYRTAGWVPLAAGVLLLACARLQFARRRTNIMTFGVPDRLVTDGVFRFSRNPMYLGFALLLLGGAMLSGALAPLLLALSFVPVADRWYIAFEERMLAATFGEEWEGYRRRVRRWV